MKKASRIAVKGQPPEPNVSVPTANAASAPPRSSAWARQAPPAMSAANTAPKKKLAPLRR
jgi:hypothetical protein